MMPGMYFVLDEAIEAFGFRSWLCPFCRHVMCNCPIPTTPEQWLFLTGGRLFDWVKGLFRPFVAERNKIFIPSINIFVGEHRCRSPTSIYLSNL